MARTKDFDENDVLTRAMLLFWNRGYNGTSMQDLVDGLGISRSSLYDTYTDKHTLFLRALEHYQKTASAGMMASLEGKPSAKEIIRSLMEYMVAQLTCDADNKGCFLVNSEVELSSHDDEIKKMLCENDRQVEAFLTTTIKDGQKTGEISADVDATAIARFVFNNIKGMRVTARSGADKKVFDDIVDMTMKALG